VTLLSYGYWMREAGWTVPRSSRPPAPTSRSRSRWSSSSVSR
jgi:hypothetical protein